MSNLVPFHANRCLLIGDSHVYAYRLRDGVAASYTGPITMHRVGRDGTRSLQLDRDLVASAASFGFIFGEIDVRVHVAKQCSERASDGFAVIHALVQRYMRAVIDFAATVPHRHVAVFSTIPPAGRDHPCFDVAYPRTGSDEQRAAWAIVLNQMLRREAHRNGFIYIDQYSMFVDEDGLLDLAATDDGVHIRSDRAERVDLSRLSCRCPQDYLAAAE